MYHQVATLSVLSELPDKVDINKYLDILLSLFKTPPCSALDDNVSYIDLRDSMHFDPQSQHLGYTQNTTVIEHTRSFQHGVIKTFTYNTIYRYFLKDIILTSVIKRYYLNIYTPRSVKYAYRS